MKKAKYMLPLLLSLLLTSCGNHPPLYQEDWHINTLELADEYFPKYFEKIETILNEYDIQYENEYSNQVDKQAKVKSYRTTYTISETVYMKVELNYLINSKYMFSDIKCDLYYNVTTEEDMLNIPQKYIDVMKDITNFCGNNCVGDEFNNKYSKLKEKYLNGDTHSSGWGNEYLLVATYGSLYPDTLPSMGINMDYKTDKYRLDFILWDYLTDTNIWNK
ncbi:MAG: hypothetical protein J1F32_06495 [Erysipelotrichales bacterium]|nr:hypothetical protein [Erysipelotrichales bacterium]